MASKFIVITGCKYQIMRYNLGIEVATDTLDDARQFVVGIKDTSCGAGQYDMIYMIMEITVDNQIIERESGEVLRLQEAGV